MGPKDSPIPVHRWGSDLPYVEAAHRQEALVAAGQEALILCEHPATITLGTASQPGDLTLSPLYYERMGITVHKSPRGGKATYHGPGQLVCYPILDLRQRNITVHTYLRFLETLMMRVCRFYGIAARCIEGKAGAWVEERKIGFVGVRVRRGFSFHGCSLNVLPQVQAFQTIVPCGMPNLHVTSIHEESGQVPTVWDAADLMETYFFKEMYETVNKQKIA